MPVGHVLHSFVFDLGGEVDLDRVAELVREGAGRREGAFGGAGGLFEGAEARKIASRYLNLPRPLLVRFPHAHVETTAGHAVLDVSARVYGVGAVSVSLRRDVDVPTLGDLVPLGRARLRIEGGGSEIMESFAKRYFETLRDGMRPALENAYDLEVEPEPYVVYALRDAGVPASGLMSTHREAVAGLLAGEIEWQRLGSEEVADNLRHWFRYYEDDLAVIDWDYALLVDPSGRFEDELTILELANLQLLELRTYDRYLESVIDKAYGDLEGMRGAVFRSARNLQRELADVRIDLSRVTDNVENIGKIIGDYYLAKVYGGAAERFHLREWQRSVNEKLTALNEIYALATHEVEHRRGVILESAIVLLIVLDIVLVLMMK